MKRIYAAATAACLLLAAATARAQTDMDAIMMGQRQLCIGPMFSYSSWNNYWEGTLKRDNLNLGTVSASMYSVMGAYGLKDNLNLLFGVPYVRTAASAGTLARYQGIPYQCICEMDAGGKRPG